MSNVQNKLKSQDSYFKGWCIVTQKGAGTTLNLPRDMVPSVDSENLEQTPQMQCRWWVHK